MHYGNEKLHKITTVQPSKNTMFIKCISELMALQGEYVVFSSSRQKHQQPKQSLTSFWKTIINIKLPLQRGEPRPHIQEVVGLNPTECRLSSQRRVLNKVPFEGATQLIFFSWAATECDCSQSTPSDSKNYHIIKISLIAFLNWWPFKWINGVLSPHWQNISYLSQSWKSSGCSTAVEYKIINMRSWVWIYP